MANRQRRRPIDHQIAFGFEPHMKEFGRKKGLLEVMLAEFASAQFVCALEPGQSVNRPECGDTANAIRGPVSECGW
jgi:hypothetical protein